MGLTIPALRQTYPGAVSSPAGRTTAGRTTQAVLVTNVAVQVAIVVTGGLVRLTGSGLGCPTWPECVPGSYTPVVEQEEGFHSLIEFGNRLLTFLVGIVALATLVAVWRLGRRHLRVLGAAPLVGVVLQAGLGGVTVLTALHPATVAAHFLLSMVLVAVSTVLLLRVRDGDGPARPAVPAPVRTLSLLLALVAAVVLAVGTVVTGSGPHSGDAEEPARFGLDPRTVSWLHADLVLLFVGLLVGLLVAFAVTGAPAVLRRRGWWLLGVTLTQGAVGYVQYATDLPEALVAVHMLGAGLLVVAVTAVVCGTRTRPPVDVLNTHDAQARSAVPG